MNEIWKWSTFLPKSCLVFVTLSVYIRCILSWRQASLNKHGNLYGPESSRPCRSVVHNPYLVFCLAARDKILLGIWPLRKVLRTKNPDTVFSYGVHCLSLELWRMSSPSTAISTLLCVHALAVLLTESARSVDNFHVSTMRYDCRWIRTIQADAARACLYYFALLA